MLDLQRLENVKHPAAGKLTARCPACHEAGGDRRGEHLVCWTESGKFACAVHPGDREHRRRIWQLAGLPDADRRAPRRRTRAEIERSREESAARLHRRNLDAAARRMATHIFAHDWSEVDLWEESSIRLDGAEPDWHLLITILFAPDAVLWIGDPRDSGPGHESHFQSCPDWMESYPEFEPPRPMTCPDTFQPGSFSRCTASVLTSPFLVIEADEAIGYKPETADDRAENLRRNLCLLRWLRDELHWSLRAVIHTGGKSVHGWFERPPSTHIEELKAIAPALGMDTSVFSPAHPVRLPGVKHEKTGVRSRLLFLA